MAAPFTQVSNEDAILNYIFDPNKSFIGTSIPQKYSKTVPNVPSVPSVELPLVAREREAKKAAEAQDYDTSLTIINSLIEEHLDYASAYNNRAQIKRLAGKRETAKQDLNTAIDLATKKLEDLGAGDIEDEQLSSTRHRLRDVLKLAYAQRAIMNHEDGDEGSADADLHKSALYGYTLAYMATTNTNPFATLCQNTVALMLDQTTKNSASGE